MRLLIRLHVWLDVKDSDGRYKDCFYGEKTVEVPVFPAMIAICGHVLKQEGTDGGVPCYNVDCDAYTFDVETECGPRVYDNYIEQVRAMGFADPCENDEQ